jgi:hypothetical protein
MSPQDPQQVLPSFWGGEGLRLPQGSLPWGAIRYPGMPDPSAYMPGMRQPMAMPDLSGRSHSSSPAASGFAPPASANVFARMMGQNMISSSMDTALARLALGPAAAFLPMGVDNGMSRFGASTAMARQAEARKFESSMAQANPLLQGLFGSVPGLGGSPMARGAIASLAEPFLGNVKGGFNTVLGTMGDSFGGDLRSQAASASRFTMASAAGLSSGTRWDFGATHGMGFDDLMGATSRASRMGVLGVSREFVKGIDRDMQRASGLMEMGDDPSDPHSNFFQGSQLAEATAKRAAQKASGIAEVVTAGRDVFGRDASAEDIFSGVKAIFGDSSLKDPSKAAARLRELSSASQVLDLDTETMSKYVEMMKKVAENAGAASSSSANRSALAMISNVEGIVRSASDGGVQLDRNTVAEKLAADAENYGGSMMAQATLVSQNYLDGLSESELLGNTVDVGGVTKTMAQVKQEFAESARIQSDPNATPEQRMAAAAAGDKLAEAMSGIGDVAERMGDGFNEKAEGARAARRVAAGTDVADSQRTSGAYSAQFRRIAENLSSDEMALMKELADEKILDELSMGDASTGFDMLVKRGMDRNMSESDAVAAANKTFDILGKVDKEGNYDSIAGAGALHAALGDRTEQEAVKNEIAAGKEKRSHLSAIYGEALSADKEGFQKAMGILSRAASSEKGFATAFKEELKNASTETKDVLAALAMDDETAADMVKRLKSADSDEGRKGIRAAAMHNARNALKEETDGGALAEEAKKMAMSEGDGAAAGSADAEAAEPATQGGTAATSSGGGLLDTAKGDALAIAAQALVRIEKMLSGVLGGG